MARDISAHNRAVMRCIEALGYRIGIGEYAGVWIATAKNDRTDQFHTAKADSEDAAIAALAESVGIDLRD